MSRPDDEYAWLKPGTPVKIESTDDTYHAVVLERRDGKAKLLWSNGTTSWLDEMDCEPR